jgi:hypothetical protein
MRKALIVTAAVAAAVFFFLVAMLPPAPASAVGTIDSDLQRRTVPGAFHVHSTRSDGAATKQEIAAAASRAGLRFIVFSEHGDGIRALDPPEYVDGVLCIDAVEISTNGGHYVAVGIPQAPYRLGGEPSAVVEDVRRLGGFGVAAHPDSRKAALAWTDWSVPIDGIEWLSADSEWRNESRVRLARALLQYPFRPAAVIASIFDRPTSTLARWDALASQRRVVGLAGHDAHGDIGRGYENGGYGITGVPSYEAAFRSFALRLITSRELSADPPADAGLLLDALRSGRVFTAIDALALPAFLDFRARQGSVSTMMGEQLPSLGRTTYSVRATVPPRGRLVLLRNGGEVASVDEPELSFESDEAGAYRVEIRVPSAPGAPAVPWLVSNPIYALAPAAVVAAARETPLEVLSLSASPWRVEKDPRSEAVIAPVEGGLRLRYRLEAGAPASQFVAAVAALPAPLPDYDAILFEAQSDRPARMFVQLRFDRNSGERLGKSVYVSPQVQRIVVRAADLVSVDRSSQSHPDPHHASSLLVVVDLTNAVPGASGEIVIRRPSLALLH